MNHIEYFHRAFSGVSRIDFPRGQPKINENMRFYSKNMGIMLIIVFIKFFFYLNSRVGGGSGAKVPSIPSGLAPVLT